MANTNNFVPFAPNAGTNDIESLADYATDYLRTHGNQGYGAAMRQVNNRALRQGTVMSAAVAQAVSDLAAVDMIDDGTTATLVTNVKSAWNAAGVAAGNAVLAAATGVSIAPLVGGLVPNDNLPASITSVVEVATYADLPATGVAHAIYKVTTPDSTHPGVRYQWTGTSYIETDSIGTPSPATLSTGTLNGTESVSVLQSGSWVKTTFALLKSYILSAVPALGQSDSSTSAASTAFAQRAAARGEMLGVRKLGTTSEWIWYKPDGSLLDVTGTTTSGMQEALDYTYANGGNFAMVGGGTSTSLDYGLLYATTPIQFHPMRNCNVSIEGVHIESSSTTYGVVVDSCMMVQFKFVGEVVMTNACVAAWRFYPTVGPGVDPLATIGDSMFHITTGVTTNAAEAVILFDCTAYSICNGEYHFSELNGNDTTGIRTLAGIKIVQGTANREFAHNIIVCPHIHGSTVGIQVGDSTTNASYIHGNQFYCSYVSDYVNAIGMYMYGVNNAGVLVMQMTGLSPTSYYFQTSSARNNFVHAGNPDDFAMTNLSTTCDNAIQYQRPRSITSVTLSGSPYTYQNKEFKQITMLVEGGTVSTIQFSNDGTTFYSTGVTQGMNVVFPGQYFRVIYSVAPNVRLIKQ